MTTENFRTQILPEYTYLQSNSSRGLRASKFRIKTPYMINSFNTLFQPKKAHE